MDLRIEGFQRSATRSVWSPGVSFKRQTRPLDEPTMYKFCFIKLLYGKCNSLKSDGMRKILSFSFVSQEHGNCVRENPLAVQVFGKMVVREWVIGREQSEPLFLHFVIVMTKDKVR